jgi:hypothetical protein
MKHEGRGRVGGQRKKGKNGRLSVLELRHVRLELPGASRKTRSDLLALRSCVLPSTTGWRVRWSLAMPTATAAPPFLTGWHGPQRTPV